MVSVFLCLLCFSYYASYYSFFLQGRYYYPLEMEAHRGVIANASWQLPEQDSNSGVSLKPVYCMLLLQRTGPFIPHWFIPFGAVKDMVLFIPTGGLQDAHTHASPRGVPPPGRHTPTWSSSSWTTRLWEDITCTRDCWGEVYWRLFAFVLLLLFVSIFSHWSTWARLGEFSGGLIPSFFSCCSLWDVCFFFFLLMYPIIWQGSGGKPNNILINNPFF